MAWALLCGRGRRARPLVNAVQPVPMPQSTGAHTNSVALPPRLLRSRLGRRLLLLFVGCALVPTCAVALLSFFSVTGQLTREGQQRLVALAKAAGRTLSDRIIFFESDLRRQAPQLLACAAAGRAPSDCGGELLYAAEEVAALGPLGRRSGAGSSVLAEFSPARFPRLAPGTSALLARKDSHGAPRFYLAHRPEGPGQTALIARLSADYLWSETDSEGLPGQVTLALVDPEQGTLLGPASQGGRLLSADWTLARGEAMQVPGWRVVLTEPRGEVIAPVRGFTRTFPLVLVFALLGVVGLSLRQIRRSLVPLEELQRGTRRIAAGDFHTPVLVGSGDELEELGGAFNSMTGKLARQFHALETAAEIDRAVLSTVDTGTIAQTVLDRIPELCPCRAVSLTVLAPDESTNATTWLELRGATTVRSMAAAGLTAADILQTLQQPEWLILGTDAAPVPGYLTHLVGDGKTAVVACPLHQGGELLGILAIGDDPGERSNEGLLYMRRLADRVAVALSNARMMDQVRVLAFYDSLTRLPNRILYKQRLGQAIGRAGESGRRVAVCSLDLDHFSRINDTMGHELGDRLLQEVAARVLRVCRQENGVTASLAEAEGVQVARLGGDEFSIILPQLGETEEAFWLARRVLETFQHPFRLGSQEVFVTASIGLAVHPQDGADPETLHKNAEVAMSHAKTEGRNGIEAYSASMNAEALGRMRLEHELRKAVEHGEFLMWYQPIVDLRTRWATGAEALVRWEHPERGLTPPAEFIGLCEESGLIVPLGEWILRSVCTQLRRWEEAGLEPLRMSVNLSARQLRQRGIVRTIQDILDETGVRPGALSIELTESLLMEQGGTTERRIRELAELGVTLAIDDFGTGYSSLSYLKNFPVSTLKIDRSFIVDVTSDPDAAAITTAIIALAKAMDLDVVAEGVENKAQAAFLRERGCQKVQGYLFGRPAPLELFTDYLRARQRRRASA